MFEVVKIVEFEHHVLSDGKIIKLKVRHESTTLFL